MSLNLETILQGVKADVVVLDRRRQIVYRNHPVDGDAILTAAVLAAVDMTFSQKKALRLWKQVRLLLMATAALQILWCRANMSRCRMANTWC